MAFWRHDEHEPAFHSMNIIIVRNAYSLPWRIDLGSRFSRWLAVASTAGCALFFVAVGVAVTLWVTDPRRHDLREVAQMRAVLAAQREQLASIDQASRRDLDALALQLGQLQAQATRLNALGDRLTQVGKLDDGEFNFSSEPALGGPEEPAAIGQIRPQPLQAGVDDMRAEFDRQEAQLDVLDSLLRDRKIDNALLPSGMPVAQGYISSPFGARSDPLDGHAGMHMGLDFDAPLGSAVLAVADGVVTFVGERSGYGNVVEIDHGNGYMTRYAHNSAFVAQVGARVHSGDVIAKVGSTGRSTGPHCHFEVWLHGRAVNPMVYVRSTRAGHA
jgi:murein DD-endopeptidase MepM/ murein hydrolase activator NlpD